MIFLQTKGSLWGMFDTSLQTLQSDFTNNNLFLRYLRTSLTSKKILNKFFVKTFKFLFGNCTPCQNFLTWYSKVPHIFDKHLTYLTYKSLENSSFFCSFSNHWAKLCNQTVHFINFYLYQFSWVCEQKFSSWLHVIFTNLTYLTYKSL